jgi:tRNA(adenine34) deaminase
MGTRRPVIHPDTYFMQAALAEARLAAASGEVPIGAVIVRGNRIIARGHNRREALPDATAHAEIMAIRSACRRLKTWRLDDCDLYVTLEPCVMCAGAIVQARIRKVYYGATDPRAGAVESITQVFSLRQNHTVAWEGHLLAEDCSQVLRDFFRYRRLLNQAAGSRAVRRAHNVQALRERQERQQKSPGAGAPLSPAQP